MYNIISPADWNLSTADRSSLGKAAEWLAIDPEELQSRCHHNTYRWLPRQYSKKSGAFHGHYDARQKRFFPPQLVNLIAPWQLMATFDRYTDAQLLDRAVKASDWLFHSPFVLTHPMSLGIGGVRELDAGEAWVKFTAEHVLLNLGLRERSNRKERYLERAEQSGQFLIQAARHHFGVKLLKDGSWSDRGWQAFGRAIEALLSLFETTGQEKWRTYAIAYGEFALSLQAQDGGFYLIDGDMFNSDLAADPLRALFFLSEETNDHRFRDAGIRFADWLLLRQAQDGSWPLSIDRDGNVVCPTIGPGDIPNIGIGMLKAHQHTNDQRYLDSAVLAFRYSLSTQITPRSDHPYKKDPNVQWGFWSWMPQYDYSVSGDQSTHHVRGLYFLMDYCRVYHKKPNDGG